MLKVLRHYMMEEMKGMKNGERERERVCACVCVNKALKDITYTECLMECFYFVFKMLLMEKGQL